MNAMTTYAGPGLTTYQAKIIKPDGYPLEAANVNFKFTILDPLGNCVIFSETHSSVNMNSTGGLISFSLGSGIKTYPASATTFEQAFSNITPSLSCEAGAPPTYTPASNDIRKIVMQFHDGSGWQTLPAMNINAVPYAMYANDAQKLGGVSATAFVQDADLPTCVGGQALYYNGTSFSCVAIGGAGVTSATITAALGYTPADGASFTSITSDFSSVSSAVFSVSSTVSSLTSSVAASFAAITSSQWVTSGTQISYAAGIVGIGTSKPSATLTIGGVYPSLNLVDDTTSSTIIAQARPDGSAYLIFRNQAGERIDITESASGTFRMGYNGSFNFLTTTTSGLTGMGNNMNPTAKFHLGAGTSSTAALKLTSGTLLTSPQSGTIEYDGFNFYITDGTNTRRTIATDTAAVTSSSIVAALGYTPANSSSFTTLASNLSAVSSAVFSVSSTVTSLSSSVSTLTNTVAASFAAIVNSQWVTSGTTISYTSGKVGIGTSDPKGALDVSSSGTANLGAVTGLPLQLRGSGGDTTATGLAIYNPSNPTGSFFGITFAGASFTGTRLGVPNLSNGVLLYGNSAGTNAVSFVALGTSNPAPIYLSTDNFIRQTITSAGNVGIGTSDPISKLEVIGGDIRVSGNLTSENNTSALGLHGGAGGDGANIELYGSGSANSNQAFFDASSLQIRPQDGSSVRMQIDSLGSYFTNGNVGIGTTTPTINSTSSTTLHIHNSLGKAASMHFTNSGTGTTATDGVVIGKWNDDSTYGNGPIFWNYESSPITFATSSTERMIISAEGNVGIGNTSPTAALHIKAGTSSLASLKFTSGSLTTAPQSGAIEYDGFKFYATNAAGTRSAIVTGTNGHINLLDPTNTFGSGHKSVVTGSDSNGLVWHMGVSGTQALDINSRYPASPITMSIGGSEMMRVMGNTGFVGIGTQTPMQKLDVHGYMRSVSGAGGSTDDGGRLIFGLSYTGTSTYDMGHVGGYTYFAGNDGSGAGVAGGLVFSTKQTTGATSATERMRIDQNGNVGIGTTEPATSLHIFSTQPASAAHPNRAGLILESEGTSVGGRLALKVSSDTENPLFVGYRARGTASSPTALVSGDIITSIAPVGYDGAGGWQTGAHIRFNTTENWSAGGIGSSISFRTPANSSTSVVERMKIDHNGNVGIGTTAPLKHLHVVSGSMVGSVSGFPAAYATVHNEFHSGILKKWTETTGNHVNSGVYSLVAPASSSVKSNHSLVNILFTDVASGVTSTGSNNSFYNFAARNRYPGNVDSGSLSQMVGIRNEYGHENGVPGNTPSTTQVFGALFGPRAMSGNIAGLYDLYISSPAGGGTIGTHYSIYQEATSATNYFGSRVGIGTNVPDGSLHIVHSGLQTNSPASGISFSKSLGNDYQIQLTQNGGTPHIDFSRTSGGDYDARISSPAFSTLSMGTASSGYLLNLYNNFVGIGTQTPTRALQVGTTGSWQSGSGILIKGSNPGLEMTDTQTTPQRWLMGNGVLVANDGNLGLAYNVNTSTHNIVVTSGGMVGIGTMTPDEKFVVNNGTTIGRYTVGGWVTTSDRRSKHDINSLENSLDKILQIRGVEYKFNNDPENKNQLGFIAQEVEPIFPEVVTTDKKGFKSMVYANLVAPLVEAVKSLYVQLKENILETRQNSRAIASLQEENEKLKIENQQKAKELDDVKSRLERIEKMLNSNQN